MITHDLGRDRGGVDAPRSASITARALVIAVDSDRLFPPAQSERIAAGIPGAVRCAPSTPTTATTASSSRRTWWARYVHEFLEQGAGGAGPGQRRRAPGWARWPHALRRARRRPHRPARPVGPPAVLGHRRGRRRRRRRAVGARRLDRRGARRAPGPRDGGARGVLAAAGRARCRYTLGEYVGTYVGRADGHRGDHASSSPRRSRTTRWPRSTPAPAAAFDAARRAGPRRPRGAGPPRSGAAQHDGRVPGAGARGARRRPRAVGAARVRTRWTPARCGWWPTRCSRSSWRAAAGASRSPTPACGSASRPAARRTTSTSSPSPCTRATRPTAVPDLGRMLPIL